MIGFVKNLLVLFFIISFSFFLPHKAQAQITPTLDPPTINTGTEVLTITLTSNTPVFDTNSFYTFAFFEPGMPVRSTLVVAERRRVVKPISDTVLRAEWKGFRKLEGEWTYVVFKGEGPRNFDNEQVFRGTYKIGSSLVYTPPCDLDAKSCPTALGNISTDPTGFIKTVFGILLSLAGGIALILIIVSGYRLMASQGNPEKVQAAREQLTSAIVGLLFIIFSLSILTIIGVDILRIPGFR